MPRSSVSPLVSGALLLGLCAAPGCNMVQAIFADAKIDKMVPGGNVATGGLDCWLTLEFQSYPKGVDPKDVEVRFRSEALVRPATFGWAYIAERDVVSKGAKFGSGHASLESTTPDAPPPLDEPIKVRFPLQAKHRLETSGAIWLYAELWWGGKKQDTVRRTIDHVYRAENAPF